MAGIIAMALDQEGCADEMRRGLRTLAPGRGDEYSIIAAPVDGEIRMGTIDDLFDWRSSKSIFRRVGIAVGGVGFRPNSMPVFIKDSKMGSFVIAGDITIVNRAELRKKFPYLVGPDIHVCAGLIAGAKHPVRGLKNVFENVKGRCNIVILSLEHGLFAYRDRWGFRSFSIARSQNGCGVCSESASMGAALRERGTDIMRDVFPAEVIKVEPEGFRSEERFSPNQLALCPFDVGYTHNGASVADGIMVDLAKFNMGTVLAEDYPVEADIVSSFPLSGTGIAEGVAFGLGIPFKSVAQYVPLGRSFLPSLAQERRERGGIKLLPMNWVLRKFPKIVFGDDSIVEGNQLLRRILTYHDLMTGIHGEGNFELHARIGCPQKTHTCLFKPEQDETLLFAATRDLEVMRKELRLTSLQFTSVERFLWAVTEAQTDARKNKSPYESCNFCTSCFGDNEATMQKQYFDFSI